MVFYRMFYIIGEAFGNENDDTEEIATQSGEEIQVLLNELPFW